MLLCSELFVEREKGGDVEILAKELSTFETLHAEFDEETDVRFLRAEMLYKVVGGLHRTARCEEIIVDENNVVGRDGIGVNLDGVVAVFFEVRGLTGFSGKLARFATHHESSSELFSQNGAHHEASAFDAHHFGDAFILIDTNQFIGHFLQAGGILE